MNQVWETQGTDGADRLVLLCLAQHADDDGHCFPSLSRMVQRTCLSERGVRAALRNLERKGFLQTDRNAGPRGCNRYSVQIPSTPATSAPRQDLPPANNCSTPANGGIKPRQDLPPNSNESSKNSHIGAQARLEIVHSTSGKRTKPKASFTPEEVKLPEGTNRDTWNSFVQMRKENDKPIKSQRTLQALGKKLARLVADGHDANHLIEKSIERGWLSFYAGDDTKAAPKPKVWEEIPEDEVAAQWRADLGA